MTATTSDYAEITKNIDFTGDPFFGLVPIFPDEPGCIILTRQRIIIAEAQEDGSTGYSHILLKNIGSWEFNYDVSGVSHFSLYNHQGVMLVLSMRIDPISARSLEKSLTKQIVGG